MDSQILMEDVRDRELFGDVAAAVKQLNAAVKACLDKGMTITLDLRGQEGKSIGYSRQSVLSGYEVTVEVWRQYR